MFNWLKKAMPFRKKELSVAELEVWGKAQQEAMQRVLGPMDEIVGHAIIPFQIGGPVDMYYFSKLMPGTVFATMELLDPIGKNPKPNRLGTYELVTCTKLKSTNSLQESYPDRKKRIDANQLTPFEIMEMRMRAIMTGIGFYSFDAVLQPGQTAELPNDNDAYCLLFDEFRGNGTSFDISGKRYGLLLITEIFRSEMSYAMQYGSAQLVQKLKAAGAYPYSDLDRQPVV